MSDALVRVRRAARARERSEREWRDAILAARAEGETLRAIGSAAGVSNVYVHKIVRADHAAT